MAAKMGFTGKLFYFAGLLSGTPTWTEATNVKDLTKTGSATEVDTTTRASAGFKSTDAGLIDAGISFEIQYDTADGFFSALRTAFFARSTVAIKCLDGGTATSGKGLVFDGAVTQFEISEPLDGAMTVSVTIKPSERGTAPSWQTGS